MKGRELLQINKKEAKSKHWEQNLFKEVVLQVCAAVDACNLWDDGHTSQVHILILLEISKVSSVVEIVVVIEAFAEALPSKVAVAVAVAVADAFAESFADAKDLVVQQPAEMTALTCEGTAADAAAAVAADAAAADAAAAAAAADAAAAAAADAAAVVKTKIDLNVAVPTLPLTNFASSEFAVAPTWLDPDFSVAAAAVLHVDHLSHVAPS